MSIVKMGKSLVIVASAMFLFACASTEKEAEEPVTQVEEVAPVVDTPEESEADRMMRLNKEAREAAGSTVYFELDEDVVSSKGRAVLEAHAWFLSQPVNANTVVTVDGHCDERGTPAYNLALGERRAKAVAQILMSYGVSSSQIKTVSHGEEQPANPAHNEAAWAENRRAVLDYAE